MILTDTLDPNPELIGRRVGRLVILNYVGRSNAGSQKFHTYRCQCECGKKIDVRKAYLLSVGVNRSCGCYKADTLKRVAAERTGKPRLDIKGKRLGKLKIKELLGACPESLELNQVRYLWKCECECGNVVSLRHEYLVRKNFPRRSCGKCPRVVKVKKLKALKTPKIKTPKAAKARIKPSVRRQEKPRSLTPPVPPKLEIATSAEVSDDVVQWLRSEYDSIHRRCNDPEHQYYYRFGGSGIKLAWDNPDLFIEWIVGNLGLKPAGIKILRIDRHGNFEPGNLKWATI